MDVLVDPASSLVVVLDLKVTKIVPIIKNEIDTAGIIQTGSIHCTHCLFTFPFFPEELSMEAVESFRDSVSYACCS